MHIVRLIQNTPEWEAWRSEPGVIGASDTPTICGISKYTTPRMLFNQKIHGVKSSISEYIEQRGHRFEQRAHAMAGFTLDRVFERNICGEHDEHRFIRASFDGVCFEEGRFQEIKYVGAGDFARVKAGAMLEHYRPQLIHQAFVSGFRTCDFTVYNDQADDIASIAVSITSREIEEVMNEVFAFREMLLERVPPPLCDADVLDLNDDKKFQDIFQSLVSAKERGDTVLEKGIRKIICERLPHTRVECLGIKVTKTKVGSVQFRFPKEEACEGPIGQ